MKDIALVVEAALKSGKIKAVRKEQLDNAPGYATEDLGRLGLEKRHLKWLERQGLVLRGRLPTKQGEVVRWLFLIPSDVVTAE